MRPMMKGECIEVDNNQSSPNDPDKGLNNQQWQAMIALHRTLLQEHHDFFLASQHPSASDALRRLAAKYHMLACMWRHGIHSFLELLRHRLPGSLDHMLTFIYMAYSMIALLYETVPAFEGTWMEFLGDLGRYRMAIEDDDIRDREVWTAVSCEWYSRASDKASTTGRLYHHLAILSRPKALQQLSYSTKSLCVEIPFSSTRESIMTLFDPAMSPQPRNPQPRNSQKANPSPTQMFVKAHGILFSGRQKGKFDSALDEFVGAVDGHIKESGKEWLRSGYYIGIANICAVTGYGDKNDPVNAALKIAASQLDSTEYQDQPTEDTQDQPMPDAAGSQDQPTENTQDQPMPDAAGSETTASPNNAKDALDLFVDTYKAVCGRFINHGDDHTLSHLHVSLVFIYHLSFFPDAMALIAHRFPWQVTADMLNALMHRSQWLTRLLEDGAPFPRSGGDEDEETARVEHWRPRPLPDDFALRGFQWAAKYLPETWFKTEERIDDDDKYFEIPSMIRKRKARVVWLGHRIAGQGRWLRFNEETKRFSLNTEDELQTGWVIVDHGELPDAKIVLRVDTD